MPTCLNPNTMDFRRIDVLIDGVRIELACFTPFKNNQPNIDLQIQKDNIHQLIFISKLYILSV